MSIDEAARETRISPRFLEALEAEQFDELPAPVYVRGFLRSYANYLKLEAQPLLDRLIGGDVAMPRAAGGYVGANGRDLQNMPRRNDPFQRSGVVAAPAVPGRPKLPQPEPTEQDGDDQSWAPEPLAPFTAPHQDHGYVPGSDLMEAPEYGHAEPYAYAEPEPIYTRRLDRRQPGVLAERPGGPSDPGSSRRIALFGGGVLAVLAFLALAVVLTRGDDDPGQRAQAVGGQETPAVNPGSVIPVGTRTAGPPSGSASSAAGGAASATASATADAGTTTPQPTPGPGTPTATATTATTPTRAATAAPTPTPTTAPPTATPTRVPVVNPENLTFGECTPTNGSYDCGGGPYRVICFAPLGYPQNRNWWVDRDRSFGAIPEGWKEFDGLLDNGDIIEAGQSLCATP